MNVTLRQADVLRAIVESSEKHGYPPSVREIGDLVGLFSSSTVQTHLRSLEKHGLIERDPTKPRALALTAKGRQIASALLGRPLEGILVGATTQSPSDEAGARAWAISVGDLLDTPAVLERAVLRVRDKHRWMNEQGASEVVRTSFAAVKECLG